MRPGYHVLSAALSGYPYYMLGNSAGCAAVFSAAAVLMDVDHLVDYVLWNKRPLSLARFFETGSLLQGSRMVFFFHGYECVALCYLASWWLGSAFAFAVANGFLLHLALDEIGNRLPSACVRINSFFYFFIYRFVKGFRVEKITRT